MQKLLFILCALTLVMASCHKMERPPLVSTVGAVQKGGMNIIATGVLYSEGDAEVTEKGFYWTVVNSTSTVDAHAEITENNKSFSGRFSGLSAGTTYEIRAFATNKFGTATGSPIRILVHQPLPPPTVTAQVSLCDLTSIALNASTSIMPGAVSELEDCGLCWTVGQGTPTISDNLLKVPNNYTFSVNTASSTIRMQPNTVYSIRAYARTFEGVGYSNLLVVRTAKGTLTDYDNNTYRTVMIGGKEWTAENLRATHYADGTLINFYPYYGDWISDQQGAYGYYNNMTELQKKFGNLYNFYAVSNSQHPLAPPGWHVPTKQDWLDLIAATGNSAAQVASLMEAGDWVYNTIATNETGFGVRPGGYRTIDSYYYESGYVCRFWTSTMGDFSSPYPYMFGFGFGNTFGSATASQQYGHYVRLVRD